MVVAQPFEAAHALGPSFVQVSFRRRLLDAGPAPHGRVDMQRPGHVAEPRRAVGVEHDPAQVLVVEVAMAEAHRDPARLPHRPQRRGVILRIEQRHLTTDELRVRRRATLVPQECHLAGSLSPGVWTVDGDLVGIGRVVAGRAPKITLGEHPMSALTTDRQPTDELGVVPGPLREGGPTGVERGLGLRVGDPGGHLRGAEPSAPRPPTVGSELRVIGHSRGTRSHHRPFHQIGRPGQTREDHAPRPGCCWGMPPTTTGLQAPVIDEPGNLYSPR